MQENIYKKIWQLSPYIRESNAYNNLREYTAQLLQMYAIQGRLHADPFEPVRKRSLSIPIIQLEGLLEQSTCFVTGGSGCVGSALVHELLNFEIKHIFILDINKPKFTCNTDKITFIYCDIRDPESVARLFSDHSPDLVFHAAGQRDPGYAETHIHETVQTNILGTLNVVEACESTPSVKQCVFASTGKASRYFTEEVYAATKKVCEYIIDIYAKTSSIKYAIVRFTHILDNSIMNEQLAYASRYEEYIELHSPGKYVTAQNAHEAASLMLNGLIFSEHHQCKFLIVKNLAWPVESLEVALYHLGQSGRLIPIVFKGNPIGYSEKFFRGQMDWSQPDELNLLLNVYEHRFKEVNGAGDIIIARIISPNTLLLQELLNNLRLGVSDYDVKAFLIKGLKNIVEEMLLRVPKTDTVKILQWGLDNEADNKSISSEGFSTVVKLMINSLKHTTYWQEVNNLWCDETMVKDYQVLS